MLTILAFSACKEGNVVEEFDEQDKGYDYFPLIVGKYMEYQVDSIVYDFTPDGGITLESTTFIREEIVDTILDNSERILYVVERFERKNNAEDWLISDVWTAYADGQRVERTEENLRFIKMIFPVVVNSTWNGNMFIDESLIIPIAGEGMEIFKGWSYEVLSVGEQETVGNEIFPDVTTISQANTENLIELRESTEKYARGIGLVYREMRILDTQCGGQLVDCDGLTWEQKAEKGFILRQWMTSHN